MANTNDRTNMINQNAKATVPRQQAISAQQPNKPAKASSLFAIVKVSSQGYVLLRVKHKINNQFLDISM